jgi:hypothetical protein
MIRRPPDQMTDDKRQHLFDLNCPRAFDLSICHLSSVILVSFRRIRRLPPDMAYHPELRDVLSLRKPL